MLDNIAARIAAGQSVKIVAYGDSISESGLSPGWFGGATSAELNWVHQLARLLAAAYPRVEFSADNFGIGGQNSYEGLGRLDWLTPYTPDLVLVAFGANDCGYHYLPPAATALALGSLVDGIKSRFPQADVALLGTGGENPLLPSWEHLEETLTATREVAAAKGVPFVDIQSAILQATEAGARWTDFHNAPQDCHPNDQGHGVWARAVFATVQNVLAVDMSRV